MADRGHQAVVPLGVQHQRLRADGSRQLARPAPAPPARCAAAAHRTKVRRGRALGRPPSARRSLCRTWDARRAAARGRQLRPWPRRSRVLVLPRSSSRQPAGSSGPISPSLAQDGAHRRRQHHDVGLGARPPPGRRAAASSEPPRQRLGDGLRSPAPRRRRAGSGLRSARASEPPISPRPDHRDASSLGQRSHGSLERRGPRACGDRPQLAPSARQSASA